MLFLFKIISERVGPTWANHPFIPGSLWLVSSEGMFGVQCSILLQFTTTHHKPNSAECCKPVEAKT